jgi:hypothetical protein
LTKKKIFERLNLKKNPMASLLPGLLEIEGVSCGAKLPAAGWTEARARPVIPLLAKLGPI